MKRYYTLWRVSHSTQVLRRTSARICSTPKLKFVGLSILLRAGSQPVESDDSRLSLWREELVLGVVHEPTRLPIPARFEARAPRGGAPTPVWELIRC